jgi:hypothetical protein
MKMSKTDNYDRNILADVFYIKLPKPNYVSKLQKWQGRRELNKDDIVWLSKPKLLQFKKQLLKTNQSMELSDLKIKICALIIEIDENIEGRKKLARDKKTLKKILEENPFLSVSPSPCNENISDDYPWKNQDPEYPDYESDIQFSLYDDRYVSKEFSDFGLDWEGEQWQDSGDIAGMIGVAQEIVDTAQEK